MAATAVALSLFGVMCIHSAGLHDPDTAGEWRKQLAYIGIGVVLMAALAAIDYHKCSAGRSGSTPGTFCCSGS
jgi:cell division protein FtsW (lipid II flippase)